LVLYAESRTAACARVPPETTAPQFIAAHRWLYIIEQVLSLAPDVLAVVVSPPRSMALRHLDKG
jgi:hypothetical protein